MAVLTDSVDSILGLVVLLWLASRALPPAAWLVPVKAALWLSAPGLAWALGLVSAEEKQAARDLLARVRRDPAAGWGVR